MSATTIHLPRWSTSSFADAERSVPSDLEHLGLHFSACNGGRSRWFGLQCMGESVHDFVAPRFVTTLCVATAVIALLSMFG